MREKNWQYIKDNPCVIFGSFGRCYDAGNTKNTRNS